MTVSRDEVLRAVSSIGPCVPSAIMKYLKGGDTMIIGAMLSDLARNGSVIISSLKIGSSPAYYTHGQEAKLMNLIDHLKGPDQKTVKLLQDKKVVRDDTQEALTRVSLRQVKDFAKHVEVTLPEGKVSYWRFYLVSETEAAELIRKDLGMGAKKEVPKKEVKQETVTKQEKPKEILKQTKKSAKKKTIKEPVKEDQQNLLEEEESEFYEDVRTYFKEKKIDVLESSIVKKKTHFEFVVNIPSGVGTLKYYCMARSKKTINDADLSQAYVQGQKRGLPILVLAPGKLTKKAKAALETDFKNMSVKQI